MIISWIYDVIVHLDYDQHACCAQLDFPFRKLLSGRLNRASDEKSV